MANPFDFGTKKVEQKKTSDGLSLLSRGDIKLPVKEKSLAGKIVTGVKNIAKTIESVSPFSFERQTSIGDVPKTLAKLAEKTSPFSFTRQTNVGDIPKEILQGTLRSGASVGLTLANKPTLEFPNDPELDSVVRTIFGEKPKSIATRTAEAEQKAQKMGFGKASLPIAGLVVGGLTALDFTGLGGKEKAVKALVKETSTDGIIKILSQMNIPTSSIDELVEPLKVAKSSDEVMKILDRATEAIQAQSQTLKGVSQPLQEVGQEVSKGLRAIHGDVGSFDDIIPEQADSVKKLLEALKKAGPIRKTQEALYSAERAKRIAAARGIRETVQGEAGLYAELGQLKGELPKESFESLRGVINQSDIDNLFNAVVDSPKLGDFEKISARQGLVKMFGKMGGQVPTESELRLLSKVFPQEVIKELLDKRPVLTKMTDALTDILNIPRSIQSSFDLSAPFRQGVFLVGKPKQFFGAFKDMFKSFGSEESYRALMDSIEARPSYKLMRDAKLAVTDIGQVGQREEQFLSNIAERIPVLGKAVRASGRAYTGFLSKLRADVFDDLIAKATALGRTPKTDPTLIEDIAKFVNSASGRGSLGALERSAKVLNGVFFSPRLMASRLNLLWPPYYMKLDPFVRKEAIKTLLTDTSIAMTMLTLAKAAGADVGVDPRSADFGKIKIGDTRVDIMGGFQQYLKLGAQLITGELVSSTTGKVMTLGEGYKPLTRLDIIERFFLGKENPIASYVTSALQGEDVIGTKFEPGKEIVKRLIPMMAQDAVEAMKEWGTGKGSLFMIPAIFGAGIQTYESAPRGSVGAQGKNPFNF